MLRRSRPLTDTPVDKMKRIGIFQYKHPLQIHTVNLALKLAEHGFIVDIFLHDCNTEYVGLSALEQSPNVRVLIYEVSATLAKRIVGRIARTVWKLLHLEHRLPSNMQKVVEACLNDVAHEQYDYFIGIEKLGLIWVGMLSRKLGVPYLYYSLELYVAGHPVIDDNPAYAHVAYYEKKYHAGSRATIIQDPMRGKVLLESNGISEANVIYMPVSVSGDVIKEKSDFLHRKLHIHPSKKIILYMGMICKNRGSNELMKYAGKLGDDYVLVLHGYIADDTPSNGYHDGKVIFSTDMVDISDIPKIIASAHIGIALYGNVTANERLTAFSSEKIAYYMQAGLPIIARRNESYELLMEQHCCGELIEHISQFPEAVNRIDANYEHYRSNAFVAFKQYYSFDANITRLTEYLLT